MEMILVMFGAIIIDVVVPDNWETRVVFGMDGGIECHGLLAKDIWPLPAFVGDVAGDDGENGMGIIAFRGDISCKPVVVVVEMNVGTRIKSIIIGEPGAWDDLPGGFYQTV